MWIRRTICAFMTAFATSLVLTGSLGLFAFDNGDRPHQVNPALAAPRSNYKIFLPFVVN